MKALANSSSELEQYKDLIKLYVGGYDARGVPYWVFIEEQQIVGIVVIGEEPLKVIEPLGTRVSVVLIVDYEQSSDIMNMFAKESKRLAIEQGAAYSFIDIPSHHEVPLGTFLNLGYQEIAHSLKMICELNGDYTKDLDLKFVKAERPEVQDFLKKMGEFMSGSPDTMLEIVLSNLGTFPNEFIDHWYEQEQLYFIFDDDTLVGILDLSPNSYGSVANLGIAPEHRGKGYSRQLMTFALRTLKELGKETAGLRVHTENKVALQLYQSFGFEEKASYKALIWRNNQEE